MKPSSCLYCHPFPPHLHCCGVIKIIPKQSIQNNTFLKHTLSHTPLILSAPAISFIIFSVLLYFFITLGIWSYSLPPWNIEKGGIIWFGSATCQIFFNKCRFVDVSLHTYGKIHLYDSCIHLVPPKMKPKIYLYLPLSQTPPQQHHS